MNRATILGYCVGPVGAGVLSVISLPTLTWFFDPEDIGRLAMLHVAISFSTLLFCFGLDQAYIREYYECKNKPGLFLVTVIPGFFFLSLACLILTILSPDFLSSILFDLSSEVISMVIIACLIVSYLSRYLSVILRMQERSLAFSMSQLLAKALFLFIIIAYGIASSHHTFITLLSAQTLALGLALSVFAKNTFKTWFPAMMCRFDWLQFRRLLLFGFPLTIAGIASWGMSAIDKVFLRTLSDYNELAIYSVATSLAASIGIFASIFNTIWAPLVYKWSADKKNLGQVSKVADKISTLIMVIICFTSGTSWLLNYIFPPFYSVVTNIISGCMLSLLFYMLSEVAGIGIMLTRRTLYAILASGLSVVVGILLAWWLIPNYGAVGAMTATLISYWLFFVLRTEISSAIWYRFPRTKLHLQAIAMVIFSLYFAFAKSEPALMISASWILLLVVIFWKRNQLYSIWAYAKNTMLVPNRI
jgi:O-antigen/teichoic acid export membrane protein